MNVRKEGAVGGHSEHGYGELDDVGIIWLVSEKETETVRTTITHWQLLPGSVGRMEKNGRSDEWV